ncbi:hypothetical protein L2744_16090 [Shewanella profunda]|uniref:hypothetical protein n=1 Tax=Shewanella profunda TaxID=254793 RepID=UPI00200CF284|nr:hypothetical protein [Shewanella profunda]MCL1091094.1 hypothetical protein [Shewanella profunda]
MLTIKSSVQPLLAVMLLATLTACGDNTSAVEEPTAVDFDIEMSNFSMDFDTTQAFALNHRIPVSFTIRNTDSNITEVTNIPVSFSFVEKKPTDPAAPIVCSSSAIDVELPGNGEPAVVENAFIWPISECQTLAATGREVELQVQFYRDEKQLAGNVTTNLPTLTLREAGVDIEYELASESSVGLIALTEEGESPTPILSVQSGFVFNGADPYYSKVTADEIPEDLTVVDPDSGLSIQQELTFGMTEEQLNQLSKLPSVATLTYELIPENSPGTILPLMIGQEDGTTVASYSFDEIQPGIADQVNHDLYLEGTVLAVVKNGSLANETHFILRGCVVTSFSQDGNDGDQTNDCKEVDINLERESVNATAASDVSFKKNQKRNPGNSRIAIESEMDIDNTLNRNGILSRATGEVALRGNIGKSFDLKIAEAVAEAVVTKNQSSYFHQIKAFNKVVAGDAKESKEHLKLKNEFKQDKSQDVAGLGFGFGPVRLGFKISAGGRVGIDVDDDMDLLTDALECQTLLVSEEFINTCGYLTRTVAPNFSFTGRIFGGLDAGIVKAGVDANLRFLENKFPLTGVLSFGLTDDQRILVRGDVTLDHTLQTISGKVKLVGTIKVFRFRRSKSVTLVSFSSQPVTQNLLKRGTEGTLELL